MANISASGRRLRLQQRRDREADRNPAKIRSASTRSKIWSRISAPRAIWIMVPAGDPVDQTIAKLKPLMQKGDTFIDGGNSNYKDTQRRHAEA
jgi:6-phosphogluconate dehydrogenase (decarboxylating)